MQQQQRQESAEPGVRTPDLRQHYPRAQEPAGTSRHPSVVECHGPRWRMSPGVSFYMQSWYLPQVSSYVIRDTGFWLWWQFSWLFLQAMVGSGKWQPYWKRIYARRYWDLCSFCVLVTLPITVLPPWGLGCMFWVLNHWAEVMCLGLALTGTSATHRPSSGNSSRGQNPALVCTIFPRGGQCQRGRGRWVSRYPWGNLC